MSDKVSYCSAKTSQIRFSARYSDARTRVQLPKLHDCSLAASNSPERRVGRSADKSLRQPRPSGGDKMPVTRSSRDQQGSVDQVKLSKGEGMGIPVVG